LLRSWSLVSMRAITSRLVNRDAMPEDLNIKRHHHHDDLCIRIGGCGLISPCRPTAIPDVRLACVVPSASRHQFNRLTHRDQEIRSW
jgi:hypothetical protein